MSSADSGSDDTGWETESESLPAAPLLPAPSDLALPDDKLCDTCKALELTPERFVVHSNASETGDESDDPNIDLGLVEDILKKSYCPFCRLVIAALGGINVPSFEDGEPVSVIMSWNTDGPVPNPDAPWSHIPQIRILRPYARKSGGDYVSSEKLNLFPEITLLANDSPVPSTTLFARPIQQDKIDFGMVRNWISMCEDHHGQDCNKNMMREHQLKHPVDEIPDFRLIDVIDDCLVRSVDRSKYATLSYVWGGIDFLRTLNSNVILLEQPGQLKRARFYERIPWTIRDAMQVVKEIGLRYLWVDSLCIVQDDNTGKKEDTIKKMDLVYGASFLTILAATGPNADSGLPGVRPGTRRSHQPIEEIAPGFRLAFKPIYQNHIKDSSYYTRAWTFQENMFARRSLVFIGGQVVFRCQKADQWREDVVVDVMNITGEEGGGRRANDIGNFEGLIQSYSELNLSFQSDIYFAFAGVARYITLELETNLCHGIPEAYFDWFLLWTTLKILKRRQSAPSWSWSGWIGGVWPRIWDWYTRNIKQIRRALRDRTWIIWYQRVAHDSTECLPVWNYNNSPPSSKRNFYGGHTKSRFPFDCSRTAPTPRKLIGAPEYCKDILNPNPRSGYLQFWTVSATFYLDTPTSTDTEPGPVNLRSRVGIFGQSKRELGIVFMNEDWRLVHVPGEHEFILLCEGRDKRAEGGREDDDDGWRYMVMLLEWHGEWAERVAVGSIGKGDLPEALGEGAIWKEIILG